MRQKAKGRKSYKGYLDVRVWKYKLISTIFIYVVIKQLKKNLSVCHLKSLNVDNIHLSQPHKGQARKRTSQTHN